MRQSKINEINYYIEELKTKRKELLEAQSRFLKTESYRSYLSNGRIIVRDKIIKGNSSGSAAIVLPVTTDKNVILTIQPRIFTKSTIGIALPAGYIEDGENHIDGARRELQEETGYQSDNLIELCSFYQDEGCSDAFNKGFLAIDCKKVSNQKLDKDEFIKYFKCNIDELYELVDMNLILDGGSQLLIERAKEYIKKGR